MLVNGRLMLKDIDDVCMYIRTTELDDQNGRSTIYIYIYIYIVPSNCGSSSRATIARIENCIRSLRSIYGGDQELSSIGRCHVLLCIQWTTSPETHAAVWSPCLVFSAQIHESRGPNEPRVSDRTFRSSTFRETYSTTPLSRRASSPSQLGEAPLQVNSSIDLRQMDSDVRQRTPFHRRHVFDLPLLHVTRTGCDVT